MKERTSGEIRGRQVADALRASFVDVRDHRTLALVRDDTVVFVRQFEPHLASMLKQNGCIIGFDLLDRPVADYHQRWKQGVRHDFDWGIYDNAFIDFFLVITLDMI